MNDRQIFSLIVCVALCLAVLAALFLLVGNPARAQDTTRYVNTTGTDSGDCTDPGNPCATVQYAVDRAASDDVIKVATGLYTGVQGRPVPPGYPNPPAGGLITQVVYISKTVTVRGGYTAPDFADPPDPAGNPTTLDAQGQGRVLLIGGEISPTIEGLRITGGDAAGLRGGDGGDAGGGVYIVESAATLSSNQVFDNTAYQYGGGLHLHMSDAMLSENIVFSNTAILGGGVSLVYGAPTLSGNVVSGNTAAPSGLLYGAGGGLHLSVSDATIIGNIISNNSSVEGGGLRLGACHGATVNGNTISDNSAHDFGGLYLDHSDGAKVSGNTISGNNSAVQGGGLGLYYSDAIVSGNIISGNSASLGGGLFLSVSDAMVSGNTITANTAYDTKDFGGGGLYLWYSDATLTNNVVADNRANNAGSGLYIDGSSELLHNTIARNSGGDGSGVYVTNGGTVSLTNTILVSHIVGISVAVGSTATLESTLWHGNATDWDGVGTISHNDDYTGNPVFMDPNTGNYHIGPGSEALNQGMDVAVLVDIDRQPRPYLAPDLGADEYWPPGVLKHSYLPLIVRGGP